MVHCPDARHRVALTFRKCISMDKIELIKNSMYVNAIPSCCQMMAKLHIVLLESGDTVGKKDGMLLCIIYYKLEDSKDDL